MKRKQLRQILANFRYQSKRPGVGERPLADHHVAFLTDYLYPVFEAMEYHIGSLEAKLDKCLQELGRGLEKNEDCVDYEFPRDGLLVVWTDGERWIPLTDPRYVFFSERSLRYVSQMMAMGKCLSLETGRLRIYELWEHKEAGMVPWPLLVVRNRDGEELTGFSERVAALKEFKETGRMSGCFFDRIGGDHEEDNDVSTWGPRTPDDVDWTWFQS